MSILGVITILQGMGRLYFSIILSAEDGVLALQPHSPPPGGVCLEIIRLFTPHQIYYDCSTSDRSESGPKTAFVQGFA